MKLIIAGSRTIDPDLDFLGNIIQSLFGISNITRVISGGARGVDLAGERWAEREGLPYVRFVPGWGLHSKRYAAFIRNNDMGFYGDALLAVWDGKSNGTRHMIRTMEELKKPFHVVKYEISGS